jgi:signal transduction histidine kinase
LDINVGSFYRLPTVKKRRANHQNTSDAPPAESGERVMALRTREGIGIPEADQEWLFNAFHRGRNVGDRPGTGLGLVIVRRCVDLHGGTINVDSKPGEGTSVTLRLPIFSPACPAAGNWPNPQ